MESYSRHLRDCFGCFATGVTIATTVAASGELAGVTINSFSSVSLDPALLLFSLDNTSSALKIFQESSHFVLNILTERQIDLSINFARSSENKWSGVEFSSGSITGSPIIKGALAYLECKKDAVYVAGDHTIFIGHVLQCDKLSEEKPLVYYQGAYRTLGEKI